MIAADEGVGVKTRLKKRIKDWWQTIDKWRALDSFGYDQDDEVIKPQFVVEKLYELTRWSKHL